MRILALCLRSSLHNHYHLQFFYETGDVKGQRIFNNCALMSTTGKGMCRRRGLMVVARRWNYFVRLLVASRNKWKVFTRNALNKNEFILGIGFTEFIDYRRLWVIFPNLEADRKRRSLTFNISTIRFKRFSISSVFDSWMFSRLNKFRSESSSKIICLNHNSYAENFGMTLLLIRHLKKHQMSFTLMSNYEEMLIMHGWEHPLSRQNFIQAQIFTVQHANVGSQNGSLLGGIIPEQPLISEGLLRLNFKLTHCNYPLDNSFQLIK